jgi:hypothetical protein
MLAMADRDGAATEKAICLFQEALSLLPVTAPGRQDIGCERSVMPPERPESKLSLAEAPEYIPETSINLGDAWCKLTTGDQQANRRIAVEYYKTAERYYVGIPYYLPEYSATLRKLELLREPPN